MFNKPIKKWKYKNIFCEHFNISLNAYNYDILPLKQR